MNTQKLFSENAKRLPRLNIAIPRPASDKMCTDLYSITGIWKCHLHMEGKNNNNSTEVRHTQNLLQLRRCQTLFLSKILETNEQIEVKSFFQAQKYLKAIRDQMTPMRLEYVLGLRMSLRNVMTEMSFTITIVGGMLFFMSSSSCGSLGLSSAVDVEPNLSKRGPSSSSSSIFSTLKFSLFPKLKSSRE